MASGAPQALTNNNSITFPADPCVEINTHVEGLRTKVLTNAMMETAVAKVRSPCSTAAIARMTATAETTIPTKGTKSAMRATTRAAMPNPLLMVYPTPLLQETSGKLRHRSVEYFQVNVRVDAHCADVTVMIASSPQARSIRRSLARGLSRAPGGSLRNRRMRRSVLSREKLTVPWVARSEVDRPVRTFRW